MYQFEEHDVAFVAQRIAISEVRDQARRRLSEELSESEEEFLPLRLQNALYIQKHAYLLRVAIPCSVVSAAVIRTYNRHRAVNMPSVATATEVIKTMEAGSEIFKVFHGDAFDPAHLKALIVPLRHARVIPSGGAPLESLTAWSTYSSIAAGVGDSLTGHGTSRKSQEVTRAARAFFSAYLQIKPGLGRPL